MNKTIVAVALIIIAVGAVGGFLFYGPSTVAVSLKDPPPEPYSSSISAIIVSFDKIELHSSGAGNTSGWHTIVTSASVNLLVVLNVSKVLGNAQIPAGKYSEIRLFASSASITIAGTTVTYTIPSGATTGIKVIISGGFQVMGGQTTTVLLDFAFRNSEVFANPTLTLNPVVSATVA